MGSSGIAHPHSWMLFKRVVRIFFLLSSLYVSVDNFLRNEKKMRGINIFKFDCDSNVFRPYLSSNLRTCNIE